MDKSSQELNEMNAGPTVSTADHIVEVREDISTNTSLSLVLQIKVGLLKLLKFNFTSTALILLKLVHCESIQGQLHLYVFGDHICFSWWQWPIMVVILPGLAAFPMTFGMALDQLKKGVISTNTFLLSCFVPFAFYFKTRLRKIDSQNDRQADEDLKCRKKILELEEDLFDAESNGIRWTVIQLYRMLVIVLIDTIVLSPVFKSLWFSAIFVGFFAHDFIRMPYKHPFLNHLQRITSVSLFLVNLCSVPSTFSMIGDITMLPNMGICLAILRYFELFLYMVVILSLPLWKIREKYNERVGRRKKDN